MGRGGLVFQDRYRLDRLALTKNFHNGEIDDFFEENEWTDGDLNRWFEESDLDVEQLAAAAVRDIEDWLDEDTVEFEPDEV
jgi:hypothetical protein